MAGVILEVLFVPRKAETLAAVRRATESMDLNLHICTDQQEVERLLFCHRYDGLIVDHDETTETILRSLRQSPSSRAAIAIDVHDETINLQTVFSLGANFEMVYPLTVDRVRRTLHLAMGLMMLGRRRYYRHPVEISSQVTSEGREYDGWISNVSEQGLGVRCDGLPLQSGLIRCRFAIPDSLIEISLDATVVWADKTGQAGCRIEQFHQGREEFVGWICRLFHEGPTGQAIMPHPPAASHEIRSPGTPA